MPEHTAVAPPPQYAEFDSEAVRSKSDRDRVELGDSDAVHEIDPEQDRRYGYAPWTHCDG